MKIYPLVVAATTLAITLKTTPATAQEQQDSSMVQSVRLERDFSPIVQQKNKIDRQPALQAIRQKKNDATYANWSVNAVRSSEIGIVPAGQVIASLADDYHTGYVELSAGNYWNTDLKAGIKSGDFSLDGKGFFTRGKLELPYDVHTDTGNESMDWKSRLLRGDLTGTYSHTLDNDAQFEAHLGMGGTSVNTFNYRFYQFGDSLLERLADDPDKQRWGQVRADASYETDHLRLFIGYDFTHVTTPDSIPGDWRTNTLQFKGRYGWYENDNFHFAIDLDMGGVFGKERSFFTLHPTFHMSIMPEADTWRRIYFDLGFGSRRMPLMQLMEQLPLAFMNEEYKTSTDGFDLHIGYEDNEQGYLRWGAELQLNSVQNDLGAIVDTLSTIGQYTQIVQEDCFHFVLAAHLDYEYSQYFKALANVRLHTHSSDSKGLAEPGLIMSLHAQSNPAPVTMDLGLDLEFIHRMLYLGEKYKLGPSTDLNFRIDWQCNEDWRLFGSIHNMLNLKNELWPAVPAQGINVHAGFKWLF